MRWEAHTNFRTVGIGTALTVMDTPQISGVPQKHLPSGVDLWIVPTDAPWIRTRVIQATRAQATIELMDGTRWLMTPATAEEVALGIGIGTEMFSELWFIRSKA